jgi:hypothetical protein
MNDLELIRAFEAQAMPLEQMTHRAHVRIAFLYLHEHDPEEATNRMRRGIHAFNAVHAVPDGPTQGYNETTTVAFMKLVAATMAAYSVSHPTNDSDTFCDTHPQLMSKHVLRLFYSPERRMHPDAKRRFIEPDLAPLPQIKPASDDRPD